MVTTKELRELSGVMQNGCAMKRWNWRNKMTFVLLQPWIRFKGGKKSKYFGLVVLLLPKVGLGLVRCHSGVHLVVGINSVCLLHLVCSLCLLMRRVLHHKFSPICVLLFKSWRYCDLTDIEVAVIWQTSKLLWSDRHWSCCDLTDIEVTVLWQTFELVVLSGSHTKTKSREWRRNAHFARTSAPLSVNWTNARIWKWEWNDIVMNGCMLLNKSPTTMGEEKNKQTNNTHTHTHTHTHTRGGGGGGGGGIKKEKRKEKIHNVDYWRLQKRVLTGP